MLNTDIIPDLDTEEAIDAIWQKGIIVDGYDPEKYRQDAAGAWMMKNKYGDRTSMYGWEIDHVFPSSLGGENHFANLRPLNWRNNESKSDDYPNYESAVTADGNQNKEETVGKTVNPSLQKILKEIYSL